MPIVKYKPWVDPFEEFDKFLTDWPGYHKAQAFVPAIDIYQDTENVYAEVPLPGIDISDVNVAVENDVLTIEGSKQHKTEVDEKNYYRKEVSYGSFHRSVALPTSVNGEKADAEYADGVLKISIPKEEKVKPKKISIRSK